MYRKICFLTSLVLVLVLAYSASAQQGEVHFWTDAGGDHLWCNPANWDYGLPESNPDLDSWETRGIDGIINIEAMTDPVLIGPGCDAEAAWVGVGADVNTGPGVGLNMTGGTLTAMEITLGECDGGFGWMTMSGGTIDFYDYSYLAIGSNGGEGRLDMTGGEINLLGETFVGSPALEWAGTVRLPKNEGKCQGNDGVGHLQLDGGIIRARNLQMSANGTMDITGGAMVLTGRDSPELQSWYGDLLANTIAEVNDGDITAYGGSGIVGVVYIDNPDPCEPNEIWVAARLSAGSAWAPLPGNGATDIQKDVVLSWLPGDFAQATNGHHVYFGTSFADVNSRAQDANKGYVTEPNYNAGQLESLKLATPYYWAVDEVNGTHGSSPWPGPIWSFKMDRGVAKYPNPGDGSIEVPLQNVVLRWTPGLEAADVNGSQVYLGTTWAEVNDANTSSDSNVYRGATSDPCYPVPETFVLAEDYYWRIDTVNGLSLFRGDIWSFIATGFARNPHPPDGASDVPKNVILRWTRGVESLYHDVYFGSTNAEVASATTGSDEYKTRLNKGTEQYDAGTNESPEVAEQYFWRIDEVNYMTVKGYVWDFTVADYLLVDDFDLYANPTELRIVWKDSLSGHTGNAEIWVNKDANFAVDGNSVRLDYWNNSQPLYSEAKRSYASAQDWSYSGNGVTELEIDWFGDVNSFPDPPMYVKLSDGTATVQVNPGPLGYGPNDVTDESLHTWHIPLSDFNDGGVTLSGITSIILGIGDGKGEGGGDPEQGTLYFDDIRLRPPRCFPEYGPAGDFTDDCRVDVNDLAIVVKDWCRSGGWFQAAMPDVNAVVEYLFEEGTGTAVANTGSYGSSYDLTVGMSWDVNGDPVIEPNNDPCWFSDSDPCRGWTLWFDGEVGWHPGTDTNGGDYLVVPALNLNSNTVTIAAWLKPDPWLLDAKKMIYGQKESFTGLVHTRDGNSVGGMSYASGSGFTYDGSFGYVWNDNAQPTWIFESDIFIPDWQWSFAAVVIEPDQAVLYLMDANNPADPNDDVLRSATNAIPNWVEEIDGRTIIAGDENSGSRFFRGQMDTVRIYDVSLTPGQILGLAEMTGIVYVPLSSAADLCVGNKNPTDPCAPIDDQIDFCDWSKFADEWLEQKLWPEP